MPVTGIGCSSAEAEVQASLRRRLMCAPKLPSGYGRLDGRYGKRQGLDSGMPCRWGGWPLE